MPAVNLWAWWSMHEFPKLCIHNCKVNQWNIHACLKVQYMTPSMNQNPLGSSKLSPWSIFQGWHQWLVNPMSHPLSGIWLLSGMHTHITTEMVLCILSVSHTLSVLSVSWTLGVVDTISVMHTVSVAHAVTFSVVQCRVHSWCCAHCRCHACTLSLCAQWQICRYAHTTF